MDHTSVLLTEAVDALITRQDGVYFDGTFGRGGHSKAVLDRLSESGRLIAIDKDPEAVAVGEALQIADPRFVMVSGSFADVNEVKACAGGAVDGVLLDLGVSSPQLNEATRGFSFLNDGPLDMRMNPQSGLSAAEWLASAEEFEIADVLKVYGEERFSKRIAAAIVAERSITTIDTTAHLARLVSEANPRWEKDKHPATRAFQAIRIKINNELGDLERLLVQVLDLINVGGRLVVISFHSLEDRIVKRFIRQLAKGDVLPKGLPVRDETLNKRMKLIGKPVRVSSQELQANPRSRSAIMRVAEKIA